MILPTSVTTVAGLVPLMFERSFQAQFVIPMAIALSGGLAAATLGTLFVIPSLYLMLNDLRRCGHALRTGRWPTRQEVEPACQQRDDEHPAAAPQAEREPVSAQ